ncbi:NnrU family protein [Mesorhizobium sp. YC-39]
MGHRHLLANGDLASLLVFGALLVYAIVDLIAVIPRGIRHPRSCDRLAT